VNDPRPGLEDLLERRSPSALSRHDASLVEAGVSGADIAQTKGAIAAIGVATTTRTAPPDSVRDRLLASTKRRGKYGIFADRIARLFDLTVADAEALMRRIEEPDAWAPFLVDGLEMIPVTPGPRCVGAMATLVRIQPGTRFPDHTHRGEETMLVLDGGFREPSPRGEEVWRGDELLRGEGTEHALVGLPGVPCIAAAVIFGHADFR
jgi:putative transcriptional regulator